MDAAKAQGLTSLTDPVAGSAAGVVAKGRAAVSLEKSDSCFSQLAAKSRGLFCFQGLAGRVQAAAPTAPVSIPTLADTAHRGTAKTITTRTPGRRNKGSTVSRGNALACGTSHVRGSC